MEPLARHRLPVSCESQKCVVGENDWRVACQSTRGMGEMEDHTLEPYAEKFGRPDVPLS